MKPSGASSLALAGSAPPSASGWKSGASGCWESTSTRRRFGAGVDLVLEPFQDAAGRAVELLSGAVTGERTDLPEIAAEGRATG
jgi:hypothetical protein